MIMSFVGEKGGIGKSMCAGNIAAALSKKRGRKILMVDMDPQANLSYWFTGSKEEAVDVVELLDGEEVVPREVTKKLFLIPSNRYKLGEKVSAYESSRLSDFMLKKSLTSFSKSGFDVVIDTPPNLGILTIMALVASDYVFLPVVPSFFSWESLGDIKETVEGVQEHLNSDLKLGGIIINMFEKRLRLARELLEEIKKQNPGKVLAPPIRKNTHLDQATGSGMDIFRFSPKSPGAEDFTKLAKKVEGVLNGKK